MILSSSGMELTLDTLEEIKQLSPKRFIDTRGYFSEVFKLEHFDKQFVQDNLSFSKEAGTLRGLHYQAPPRAQGKLVMVLKGSVLDVVVDMRKDTKEFGRVQTFLLSEENGDQLYVPEGFAHGFITLLPDTLVYYKVTAPYCKASEGGIIWNDPHLDIKWPEDLLPPILSDKDAILPLFLEVESPF